MRLKIASSAFEIPRADQADQAAKLPTICRNRYPIDSNDQIPVARFPGILSTRFDVSRPFLAQFLSVPFSVSRCAIFSLAENEIRTTAVSLTANTSLLLLALACQWDGG
jgi:hypothetical protein